MFRLPSSLERRLREVFPKTSDRERFVIDAIEEALSGESPEDRTLPDSVGGSLHLYTDGGSRGNPGQAAVGCILVDPSKGVTLAEHAERIGEETNNVAEYRALIEGLKIALRYRPNRLICHLDSELVVKQLNGEYRVRMQSLQPLVDEIQKLAMEFPDVVFQYIPREDNWRADSLVNKALDEHSVPSHSKSKKMDNNEWRMEN